jgi:Family of unknown function (DUF6308)
VASRISEEERTRLVVRAATAPWHDVPAGSELAAANPAERDGPFDKAAALYYHFAVPHERGIGRSKIHKVLHLKRPCLYPLLDRNLVHLYKVRARDWIDVIPGAAAGDSVTYWAAIRADLTAQRNSAELVACRTALLSSSATAAMATLPAVRLLDILAWDVAAPVGKRRPESPVPRRVQPRL